MEWYDQDPRFNPIVAADFRYGAPEPESHCAWAFLEDGQLTSIPDEHTAVLLAETFPDTICFFADQVDHPHS